MMSEIDGASLVLGVIIGFIVAILLLIIVLKTPNR